MRRQMVTTMYNKDNYLKYCPKKTKRQLDKREVITYFLIFGIK